MNDRRVYHLNQRVKRVTTGEVVTIREVLPVGLQVFYRVEAEDGSIAVVPESKVRPELSDVIARRVW